MANPVKFTVKGAGSWKSYLSRYAKEEPKKLRAAMYRVAETKIMKRAKDEFVPVGDGDLRSSGRTEIKGSGFSGVVTLSFGGPGASHALAVHEHISEHSPPSWVKAEESGNPVVFSPSGRGPKFLERPFNEEAGSYWHDVAMEINK